jgi:hypothetical protein
MGMGSIELLGAETPSKNVGATPDPECEFGECACPATPLGQQEPIIASDPTSDRMFVLAQVETQDHLFAATSDGGCIWSSRKIADQMQSPKPLPDGGGDPWAVFDSFGNLWISYLGKGGATVPTILARSTDGGITFSGTEVYTVNSGPFTDKPIIATGPGSGQAAASVWVIYVDTASPRSVYAEGMALDANGDVIMNFCGTGGPFCPRRLIVSDIPAGEPGGPKGFITGDVDIGPNGEVLVTYLTFDLFLPNTEIYTAIDLDGLGPGGFTDASPATSGPDFTGNVKTKESLLASFIGIIPFPYLSWDRATARGSVSQPDGRVHLVYTDRTSTNPQDTQLVVTYSDNRGQTWTPSVIIDDVGSSQFLPNMDVDPSTGHLGLVWLDSRGDPSNQESHLYASVRFHNDPAFEPEVQVSEGAGDPTTSNDAYFEYLGVSFEDDVMQAVWLDNSNFYGDNEDDPPRMDPFTTKIKLPEPGVVAQMLAGVTALALLRSCRSRQPS